MPDIGFFDVDDTLRRGVSDWKYGGRLAELLFHEDQLMQQSFCAVVSTAEGRLLNRRAWIAKAIHNCGLNPDLNRVEIIARNFGDFVESHMLQETRLIDGVSKMLGELSLNGFKCYAVSGASHKNVEAAMKYDGLTNLLDGWYGHGWNQDNDGIGLGKVDAVRNIMTELDMDDFVGTRSFVVGDGESDMNLAKEFDLPFYGVMTHWNGWEENPPAYEQTVLIRSVVELSALLIA